MPRPDQATGPTYRFHGRHRPDPEQRTPVRAALATSSEADGVATLRLYDPIDSWGGEWGVSAKEVASVLDSLDASTTEIRLHINSPGGEVFEGIAIMNQLRAHKARVVAVVDGLAASAASFIAAGADEVVMAANSELMIHDAWGLAIGNAADMRDLADRLDHLSNNIGSVYAAKAGGTVEDWRAAMLAETWYSAEEAVTAGLADSVASGKTADPKAKARFDLSGFNYAGREEAPAPSAPAVVEPDATSVDTPASPDEKPDVVTTGMSALTERRHRMNARRHNLPL